VDISGTSVYYGAGGGGFGTSLGTGGTGYGNPGSGGQASGSGLAYSGQTGYNGIIIIRYQIA
jgi:hypothetical protein